ncbi:hypothetical protein [Neptuniibacter sp.]|uniref:hypothetical protein n=1 Tax=Neptuniibacter sp. TaxID=1962643 RepID=UPI00260A2F65|nr:hypothetical protein [Neptuniibacter sp.]MCP4596141.1 DUF413 domain-containing protein [Neptuniibacter sp.]
MNSPDIEMLRQQYCATPHEFDAFVPKDKFSAKEIQLITQYGNWFDAIWRGDVPLVTDKLRHFYAARSRNCVGRTGVEEVWFRYDSLRIPF